MIKNLLFLFTVLCFNSFSQSDSLKSETETIQIKKTTYSLFRGVLAETKTWYLLIDDKNNYYLANLDRPNDGVYDWFIRFKDSQNIYRSSNTGGNSTGYGIEAYPTLHFKKENEPGEFLNFYLDRSTKNVIFLTSISDGLVYRFELQTQ